MTPRGPAGQTAGVDTAGTPRGRLRGLAWALPWLVFQVFPVLDLLATPRPGATRALIAGLLVVFTVAYLAVMSRFSGARGFRADFALVVALALGLSVALGTSYAGLWIYVAAAAAATLPARLVWPVVLAGTAVCAAVIIGYREVVSTKVVCDGPGDQRALHVKAATA